MNYDVDIALYHYDNIQMMLDGVPRELWPIFLPDEEDELPDMEFNIINFRRRSDEREQVMALQSLCDLPLRPNQPLREARQRARLQGLRKGRIFDERQGRNHDTRADNSGPESADT